MTWPLAVFGCFSILVISIITFLTIVYLKEYNREERTIKEFMKIRDQKMKSEPLVYVFEQPKKKAPPPLPIPDKNKKNIN